MKSLSTLRLYYEPTERRTETLDFSRILDANIATVVATDPASLVAAIDHAGRYVMITIQVGQQLGPVGSITLLITSTTGQIERQTLSVSVADPAATIEETYP